MRKLFVACLGVLAFAGAHAAPEHLIPEEFFGSYLAERSAHTCRRDERQTPASPAYLVIQARYFRYGYMNPEADNSLDAMVCRATEPVALDKEGMEVHSECFLTDRLVKRHFRFSKSAGVLMLRDLDRKTQEQFEACY
ncbi:hypothetical protein [Comamonas antarctica]|uniref:Uncharacterized protein n=1 Tax=Comamonas antarctica TaxID=2743470 RepID=A0A6N1X6G0_9BURK|nr:hypothetical protein [Comamonas antarctica]QKV53410.1 hypothetical protein HUK68_11190 [Comamonas antarctica]